MLSLTVNMSKAMLGQQLQGGLILLVLGMATVFVFLTILIFTTKLLSKTCSRFAPAKAQVKPKTSSVAQRVTKDDEIAAAIVAAYAKTTN